MADLEFPSNMYLFEGFRRYGADIVYVPSDDAMRTNLERFLANTITFFREPASSSSVVRGRPRRWS